MAPLKIRVEYYFDPESRNWGFRVPALRIVGGACETREEAEEHSLDAIRYALGDEAESSGGDEVETQYVELVPVLAQTV
ncbi:MAG TPA: hypothetical protein VNV65_10335 [Candidatus Solibacter sp.]|jgi:hypothetical protein|nr:hypothetical protein [Candidatus Solibacter sp.]